jgi:hypothetical protein
MVLVSPLGALRGGGRRPDYTDPEVGQPVCTAGLEAGVQEDEVVSEAGSDSADSLGGGEGAGRRGRAQPAGGQSSGC